MLPGVLPWEEGLVPIATPSQDKWVHCHTPLEAAPMTGVFLPALLC